MPEVTKLVMDEDTPVSIPTALLMLSLEKSTQKT